MLQVPIDGESDSDLAHHVCARCFNSSFVIIASGCFSTKMRAIKYKGNCEDIAFNLFIIYFLKENPVYINTYDWKQFPSDESYSSQDDHYKIRELFLLKYNNKYLLE